MRIGRDRAVRQFEAPRPVDGRMLPCDVAEHGPRHGQRRIQFQRSIPCLLRLRHVVAIVDTPALDDDADRGQPFPAAREFRVQLCDLLEQADAFRQVPARDEEFAGLEVHLVRLEVLRVGAHCHRRCFRGPELTAQRVDDRVRDLRLDGEDVGQLAVVGLRPQVAYR